MADRFVFSNFAVGSLQADIDQFAVAVKIASADVVRFPTLAEGTKFPIVLQDTEGNFEICYVHTVGTDGTMQVERGKEGTFAQPWLAGTQVVHAFTAGTVYQGARLVPRGTWTANAHYLAGDLVLHASISYVASVESINQAPSLVSAYWQPLFVAASGAGDRLVFRGIWASNTAYAVGDMVSRLGRLWVATAINTGEAPAAGSGFWTPLAPTHNWFGSDGAFYTTAAINNYVIDASVAPLADIPTELYDGLTVKFIPSGTNTVETTTLTLGGNSPKPLRKRPGLPVPIGALKGGSMYEATYMASTQEFVLVASLGGDTAQEISYTPVAPYTANTVQNAIDEAKNYLQGQLNNAVAIGNNATALAQSALNAAGYRIGFPIYYGPGGYTLNISPIARLVRFRAIGGGGAGGAAYNVSAGQCAAGSGGSGGGYIELYCLQLAGAQLTAVVGSGGAQILGNGGAGSATTIVGVLTAPGGLGGLGMTGDNTGAAWENTPGQAPTAFWPQSAGFVMAGAPGHGSIRMNATNAMGGNGGGGLFGGGAGMGSRSSGGSAESGVVGGTASMWGAGGGGGSLRRASAGTVGIVGGAGGGGLLEVTEFY